MWILPLYHMKVERLGYFSVSRKLKLFISYGMYT